MSHKKPADKHTSPKVASEASKELKSPKSAKGEKQVAGSALSQAEGNKQGRKK